MDTVKQSVNPLDENAVVSVGEQAETMDLADDSTESETAANPEFEDYLSFGHDVYKSALLGMQNSIPKNNRLTPPNSSIVYADPVNWHPCTSGINAGTRINNTTVNYSGALNVFRKLNFE